MHAYFTEGRLISDHETLAVLADELGIPAAATIDLLRTDNYTDAVRAEEELARQFGLSGVPTFVVDRAIAVSGAQPAETLVKLLDEGWERSNAADRSRRE